MIRFSPLGADTHGNIKRFPPSGAETQIGKDAAVCPIRKHKDNHYLLSTWEANSASMIRFSPLGADTHGNIIRFGLNGAETQKGKEVAVRSIRKLRANH